MSSKTFEKIYKKYLSKEITLEEFNREYASLPYDEVYDFEGLVEKFLQKEITVKDFESTFWDVWPEQGKIPEDYWEHLNELFYNVEDFTDLPAEPDDDTDGIDEDQLREAAKKFLRGIRSLK